MTATLKRPRLVSNTLVTMASRLAEKLEALGQPAKSGLIAHALHELLDGQDESTKELRAAVQIHLAIVSNGSAIAHTAADVESVAMLSTQEAAQLMDCSRPYVAMLIDAGKLAGAVTSKGGHRRVPKSSVLQWIEAASLAKSTAAGDKDYRKAAMDAGMYAIPEEDYVKAAGISGHHATD
ncbi:excisionase family DNA-binding protein [Janthinobacterium sp.]|uniref:excisionase family DNA-binding protein n=1 Tax=Janthinobacterium sp. TaxID=1871054 RepID=UPI0026355067|nr:excisionase family DNA-binding protein [Janthinobacterium sp.]